MVSAYFCAQLQKLLIICADGEMLEVDFFFNAWNCFAAVRAGNTVGKNTRKFVPIYSSLSPTWTAGSLLRNTSTNNMKSFWKRRWILQGRNEFQTHACTAASTSSPLRVTRMYIVLCPSSSPWYFCARCIPYTAASLTWIQRSCQQGWPLFCLTLGAVGLERVKDYKSGGNATVFFGRGQNWWEEGDENMVAASRVCTRECSLVPWCLDSY